MSHRQGAYPDADDDPSVGISIDRFTTLSARWGNWQSSGYRAQNGGTRSEDRGVKPYRPPHAKAQREIPGRARAYAACASRSQLERP